MPSLLRRRILLASSLAVTAALLAGCAQTATAPEQTSAATHTVADARGEVTVPDAPKRVVALEPVELDTAVALGVTPVGAAVAATATGIPSYLGVADVATVGTVAEPDLEAIAALKPDLILGTEARHSKLYDQLSAIAPTVFMATQADPWQQNVLLIGDALNRKDEAQKLLDGFNARCAQIGSEHQVAGKTANLIRPMDASKLRIYSPTSFAGSALECVGFTIPEQTWDGDGGIGRDISPENIADAQADVVFVTTADVDDPMTIPEAITQNASLFPSLTPVDASYWLSGVGPLGGNKVLDDIDRFLSAGR
jgi:iron complex transport system substrate-binding protein